MEKLLAPIKDLIGSLYDLLFDAAQKVWSLAKPIFLIGVVFDLVTGKLGWINQLLEIYRQVLSTTSGASWLVVVVVALLALNCCKK